MPISSQNARNQSAAVIALGISFLGSLRPGEGMRSPPGNLDHLASGLDFPALDRASP
jgi:hypothetical protein